MDILMLKFFIMLGPTDWGPTFSFTVACHYSFVKRLQSVMINGTYFGHWTLQNVLKYFADMCSAWKMAVLRPY